MQVSVSVALATRVPVVDDGLDARELLRRADTAMYAAKGSGKATWMVYDPRRHSQEPTAILLI